MKLDIREIGFWIVLILSMSLLLWNVFGNSPSEFIALVGIIFVIVLKVWSISDNQIKSDINTKNSFQKIKEDMDLIKKKLKV